MAHMRVINVTKKSFLLFIIFYCVISTSSSLGYGLNNQEDTIFVLFEKMDYNSIEQSKMPKKSYDYSGAYPNDSDRKFNVLISGHMHIWFYCFSNLPEWSDMVFEFRTIDQEFVNKKDFKDQEWFRNTSKEEILNTFLGKNKIIYLTEKERIKNGKAIIIRVYPDIQTVE